MISEYEYNKRYDESKTKMIGKSHRIVSKDPELREFEDQEWRQEISAGRRNKMKRR